MGLSSLGYTSVPHLALERTTVEEILVWYVSNVGIAVRRPRHAELLSRAPQVGGFNEGYAYFLA